MRNPTVSGTDYQPGRQVVLFMCRVLHTVPTRMVPHGPIPGLDAGTDGMSFSTSTHSLISDVGGNRPTPRNGCLQRVRPSIRRLLETQP